MALARDLERRRRVWCLVQVASKRAGLDCYVGAHRGCANYEAVTDLAVPGKPNETTLRFLPDDTLVALVRREGGNRHAWIGTSPPPYTEWNWNETEFQVGGPNFIILPDGSMWAGGRRYGKEARTMLARMTLDSLSPVLELPSGGDNSYPGFVFHEGLLWMTYYASHEGKTSIYLAKIRLDE